MNKKTAILAFVALFVFGLSVASAQTAVPPDPLTVDDILTGAYDMINSLGLFALVSIAAFIGVAFMLVRRFRRAAM